MIGGMPARTYVIGETCRASSSRFGMAPSQATAYDFLFGPPSNSPTSEMPYQSTIAATFSSSVLFGPIALDPPERSPAHVLSKPADGGNMPVMSARWPPADVPVVTIFVRSKLYCFAFLYTQRSAQRLSSTAAGASATSVKRYSTLTTVQPICR